MVKVHIDFKDPQLEKQFFLVHPMLRAVLFEMGRITYMSRGCILTITSMIRTPEENRAIGGMELSAHLFARAADCRVWNLPAGTFIGKLIAATKDMYGPKIHIIRHEGGTADHIHLNVNREYADGFTEVFYHGSNQ